MNIKQIETFVRIVELGSFSAAAEALYASQSTVSARIKDLERYLGAELFDRSFHRAQLTPKGDELYEHARRLVDFTTSLTQQMRDPQAVAGRLNLGVVGVVANTWLPALVARLRERYPQLALRIDAGLTRVLMERLRDGKLDFAIVAGLLADPDLECEPLGHDEFVWMAAPTLEPPAGTIGPAEVARWPVLMLTEESHHHPVVRQWFRDAGVAFRAATASNNMNVLATLTMQGLGVSLLPRHCYRAEVGAGRLRVLDTAPALPRVPFSLVYRSDRRPPLTEAITEAARAASDLARD